MPFDVRGRTAPRWEMVMMSVERVKGEMTGAVLRTWMALLDKLERARDG